MGARLWPAEKLSPGEIGRRLLLEYLLCSEDQHNMVESVREDPDCGTNKLIVPVEARPKSARVGDSLTIGFRNSD